MVGRVCEMIRPGLFSKQIAADSRRLEFDYKNEVIIKRGIPVDFVFAGDSITHMWELNAYFGRTGKMILNRGIGGDTTEYLLKRFPADVIQLKPKCVIILIGINDSAAMGDNHVYGIQGMPVDDILAGISSHIAEMADTSLHAGIRPILCSLLPTNMPDNTNGDRLNQMVCKANEGILALSQEKGCLFADFHTAFADEDGMKLKDGLSYDGLHPHVLGYDLMAAILKDVLRKNNIDI